MTIDRAVLVASWQSWISNDDRHRTGPWWLAWLWTLLFSAALALFFTLLGIMAFGNGQGAWRHPDALAAWYGRNFIVCLTIAALIHLLFDLGRATLAGPGRVTRWKAWQRTLYFSGVPIVGLLIGWPFGVMLAGEELRAWVGSRQGHPVILGSIVFGLGITFVLHHFFAAKARQFQAERDATEARLRLLQAQIEPHFLFNTLANVSALIEHDGAKVREMLDAFTGYLRASLAGLRHDDSTLTAELDVVRAYLDLLKMRMGERLHYRIDVDAATDGVRLPPLLLQPLVENAVHHGLEAKVDGGSVRIEARIDGGMLRLSVTDDGLGLDAPPRRRSGSPGRGGLALQNLRARLLTRYGSAAQLSLVDNRPGTRASIVLPLDTADIRCGR